MRAAVLDSANAALRVEDIPVPTPGPGEVLVKVAACGVCHTDLHVIKGEVAFPTLYDGQTRLKRQDGSPLWMYSMAGLAEYAVVPATDVFALPEGIAFHAAAILGCAVFTAYGAMRNSADLHAGETVAVIAVGGVGMNLVQVARAFGASQI